MRCAKNLLNAGITCAAVAMGFLGGAEWAGWAGELQGGVAGKMLGNRDQRVRLGDFVTAGFEKPSSAECLTIEVRLRWWGWVMRYWDNDKLCFCSGLRC